MSINETDEILRRQLELHESKEKFPYEDTKGKVTIGIGHNLTDRGLPDEIIDRLYELDVREVIDDLDKFLPWWREMNETRQRVIIDMGFNMGIDPAKHGKLLTFKNTLRKMETGAYKEAAKGMRNSLWAKQVKGRAVRLVKMMEEG